MNDASQQVEVSNQVETRPVKREELPRGLRRRGNSYYAFLTGANGKGFLRSIGNVSLAAAVRQRAAWAREIVEGKYEKRAARVNQVTVAEIADKELEYTKKFNRGWYSDRIVNRLAKEWWGDRPAAEISTEEIDRKLSDNVGEHGMRWSETTSNIYLNVISKMYNLAIDRGELTINPTAKAHWYTLNSARTRVLKFEEEDLLRKAIREDFPEHEPEFDLALHTGLRKSSLYGLPANAKGKALAPLLWANVNLDWKQLTVLRTKRGKRLTVPLNEVAIAALKTLRRRSDGTGPVMIANGCLVQPHTHWRWFDACRKKAGIADFHWHDFRHTFAARLTRNKIPREIIAMLLDHAPEHKMTLMYQGEEEYVAQLREAVDSLVRMDRTDTKTDTADIFEFRKPEAM